MIAVPTAPRADRLSSVLITTRAGPASRISGAMSDSRTWETGRLRLLVTVWTARKDATAKLIHTSGSIARRDQPRAALQCRMTSVRTVTVMAIDTAAATALIAS